MDYVNCIEEIAPWEMRFPFVKNPLHFEITDCEVVEEGEGIAISFTLNGEAHNLFYEVMRDELGDFYRPMPGSVEEATYYMWLDEVENDFPMGFAPGLDVMEKCDVIEAIMSRVVPEYADAGDDCW